jgi:RimJ/RimL family protein N-acetyltransferase
MTPPTLETARLVLRAHTEADFPAMAAMWADPEVVRFITGTPSTPEETWARLLRFAGQWTVSGFGYFAVTAKEDGRYVGDVGFADYRRAVEPPIDGLPEAGWVLRTADHGKGFATEAVGAILDWADRTLDAARTVAIFHPEHAASIRVARKLGFGGEVLGTYRGGPTLILTRPRGGAADVAA